jgi:hypothetical protein
MVHILPAPTHIDADQMSPIRAADPYRATDAWDHTRAASLIAGFLGDHGAWRSTLSELAQHMLILSHDATGDRMADAQVDTKSIDNALRVLRTVGAHEEITLAANWLTTAGPADVVKRLADEVHLERATVSTLQADLALLTTAGDLLDPLHAQTVAEWATRSFDDPSRLDRLNPEFDVQSEILKLLTGITPALPAERHSWLLRWAMDTKPEHPALAARHLRVLIQSLDEDAWNEETATLASSAAEGHEPSVRYALLGGAGRYIEAIRDQLTEEAIGGMSSYAEQALGPIGGLPDIVIVALRDRNSAALQANPTRGIVRHQEDLPAKNLTIINIVHPRFAVWEPVIQWLDQIGPRSDAAYVLERLFRNADRFGDELAERLAPIAERIQDLPRERDEHRRVWPEFRSSARALALALAHRRTGVVPLEPLKGLAGGNRNSRQLAALLCGVDNTPAEGLLVALSADRDPHVRATTASVLVHRVAQGQERFEPLVRTVLQDRGTSVAKTAAARFADNPTEDLLSIFLPLAEHHSGEVRRYVSRGISGLESRHTG